MKIHPLLLKAHQNSPWFLLMVSPRRRGSGASSAAWPRSASSAPTAVGAALRQWTSPRASGSVETCLGSPRWWPGAGVFCWGMMASWKFHDSWFKMFKRDVVWDVSWMTYPSEIGISWGWTGCKRELAMKMWDSTNKQFYQEWVMVKLQQCHGQVHGLLLLWILVIHPLPWESSKNNGNPDGLMTISAAVGS